MREFLKRQNYKIEKYSMNTLQIIYDKWLNANTHNAGLWVPLASIAERRCQGGGAALIVQGSAPIIDGRVDGDCPHARGITITVAVVIATTISRCPDIDAAFSSTPLKQHDHNPTTDFPHLHS